MRMAKHASTIELRHLRYFVAAAEQGSFRKAGAAIGVHESAISRRIRDLEDQLGAALFHRHSGGVRLTFAGKRFLRRVRQIIRSLGEGAQDIASLGRAENGSVRIGIYSSIASGFLAELLQAYGHRHAKVQIGLIDGNPDEHVAAIRQLRLDVAFLTGTRDWPDCDSVRLWSERVFAVLPDRHALSALEELTWHDLVDEPFIVSEAAPGQEIHDHLVRRLADLGWHPEIHVQSVGRDNLLPLVAIGRGLTLVSEAMTVARLPGITYRPIAGEILPFSAVWSPRNDNPAFRRLLSMARGKATTEGQHPQTSDVGD
ncbi:LysR family transcriptional regulator [Paracoccus endophyticus]|uniref:LysR family transcriptional regulator n=1 Tax=Paracoccus endophyticus TaxID=2233774 RepID=UPI00197E24FD|nr:LysR family transcriptional regulator [Paracoccus endophyticus]